MAKRILYIEDEKDMRNMFGLRLESEGYVVLYASDGEEGLAKAKSEKPDLILLDLMLPKLPGEEVCKAIRNDEEIENIPIIMVSAKATDVDQMVGKVMGADSYVTKPFEGKNLIEQIKELIG